ncbi:putative bifunctional diguanylate cyclase/phosphodiesterase [Actinospongicola halichondriae]|uniref:putative bifunctional diguanylate cyclase/phosphodiesterase n=1 Tax=Actinospongicola halichondriae TaxID=3236844 RepID=UPI003D3CADFB
MHDHQHDPPRGATPDVDGAEDRYELIARGSHDGIWDLDLRSGEMYVSDRWLELAGDGVVPPTVEGWLDRIHPDDRSLAEEATAAHLARATDHLEIEVRLIVGDADSDTDGHSLRWVLIRGLADDNEPPQRIAGSITDTSDAHKAEVTLRQQALHDPLTGLPNRTFLREELNRHLALGRRHPDSRVALLFLDLVGFKAVNDHFGHDAGDEILRVIGRRLRFATRPEDLPARLGGDEFVVAMAGLDDTESALQVAERLVELLQKPITVHDHDHVIRPSAGLVVTADQRWTPESLIREADTAMYRAKRRGSERVEVHVLAQPDRSGNERNAASLEAAAREGRLLMHYQPIVMPESGLITGYEALLRWRRPGRGVVSIYDNDVDIVPQLDRFLSRWALEHAIDDAAAAITRGCDVPTLAVNISRTHLVDPDLAPTIRTKLASHSLDPEWLRLEIGATATDGLDMTVLEPIRRLGVRLHLDGFGNEGASLRRLHAVDPVAVKIDRRIISAMLDDVAALRLVRAICAAAIASDILVVASGVELQATANILGDVGCTLAQGSLYGAPDSPNAAFRKSTEFGRSTSVSAALL